MIGSWRKVALALAGATVLASCGGGESSSPRRPSTDYAALSARQCLANLRDRGAAFEPREVRAPGSCAVANAVQLRNASLPLSTPTTMTCSLAMAVDDFNRDVVRDAARRHLGEAVTRIEVIAAYSCRRVRGGGRMSEHARGQAIDIRGFRLASGRVITVREGWRGRSDERAFLRAVARGACGVFNIVLTPNSDRDHQDHFHLDNGPHRRCDA